MAILPTLIARADSVGIARRGSNRLDAPRTRDAHPTRPYATAPTSHPQRRSERAGPARSNSWPGRLPAAPAPAAPTPVRAIEVRTPPAAIRTAHPAHILNASG